jgi:glycosyltransferase involved in cell wall biosynthesis
MKGFTKMKVLHVLDEINFSGAEIMFKTAAPIFSKSGFTLHAVATHERTGPYADILAKNGFVIHHVPVKKSFSSFFSFYTLLRKLKLDVLHIHPESKFIAYAICGRLAGVKTIIQTIHSVFPFKGFLRLQRKLMRKICSEILNVKFVSISDSVNYCELKHYNNRTIKILNWIDETMYRPPEIVERLDARKFFSLPENAFVCSLVGSCNNVKRHADAIYAISQLIKMGYDAFLLHAGDGDLNNEEKELAKNLNIKNRVLFLGMLQGVYKLHWAADLFLMPSLYEGISLACIEAMRCQIPAMIYSGTYGLIDLVEHNVTGICAEGDKEQYAECLLHACINREGLLKMGKNALQKINSTFSMSKSVGEYLNLYTNHNNCRSAL